MGSSRVNAYSILAQGYDDAGFADFTAAITPRLLTLLQETGWLGRRVLDLGCGTGQSVAFFANTGMEVVGIDSSPEMLRVAGLRVDEETSMVDLRAGDIRQVDFPANMELVYCLGNVLNELNSPKEVEAVLQKSFGALQAGKRMVFDLLTLRGLGDYLGTDEHIYDVSDRFFLTIKSEFLYETFTLKQNFNVFSSKGADWARQTAFLTLKSLPLAALNASIERVGFKILGVYDIQLRPFDPNTDTTGRCIYIIERPGV